MRIATPVRLSAIAVGVLLAAGCTAQDADTAAPAAPDATVPAPEPAPSPAPEPAPAQPDATTVPTRFQGDYAANVDACASPGHVSHLAITASRIEFHESSGGITSVDASGNDIDLTARVTGEGETRDVGYSFSLSDDGLTLTDTVNGMARVRCNAD